MQHYILVYVIHNKLEVVSRHTSDSPMASLHQKLASSLERLHKLQSGGRHVFQSKEFPRADRERLFPQGFLREVIKGWLISTSPDPAASDTTPWFASFSAF